MTAAAADTAHLIRYGGTFLPGVAKSAQGVYVTLEDGRRILDFTSGQMSAILGHSHPAVVEAISRSSRELVHLFSSLLSRPVIQLAEALTSLLPEPLDRVLLLSTGAESNEAALRMAKTYTGGYEVVGFDVSWHGMTGAAASATFAAGRRGHGPGMPGVMAIPTPNSYRRPPGVGPDYDIAVLDRAFETLDRQSVGAYAAVIAEPICSAGGILEPPGGDFSRVKAECEAGTYLADGLRALGGRHECIGDVRGRGLLVGLELVADRESKRPIPEFSAAVTHRCYELGLLMNIVHLPGIAGTGAFRIAPPLIIEHREIDLALEILDQAISETYDRMPNPA
jgi:2,2-dialkylglycine decarboxylase (pyruvate)